MTAHATQAHAAFVAQRSDNADDRDPKNAPRSGADDERRGKADLEPVTAYLPFVRRVALRIARRLPSHVRLEDLIGAGVIGLLEAMDRYDPGRVNKSFEAYAEFRVKGAILDELRRRDLMARDTRIEAKKVEQAIGDLAHTLGREPEREEIASHLGLSLDELHHRLERLSPVHVMSIDDVHGLDTPRDSATPFDIAAHKELVDKLVDAIGQLKERHQLILRLYYEESFTLRQIGEVLDVTESRVCQLLSDATVRLRSILSRSTAAGTFDGPGDGSLAMGVGHG